MTIHLVTRGDDAGVSRSANLAIRTCAEQGILKNASLMAPTHHIEHAVATLKDVPGLCLGLHLTLTCEWTSPRFGPLAVADAPWLDADGAFPTTGQVLHEREAKAESMAKELAAQLDHLTALGAAVKYIDQHMGVGWVDDLDARIEDLCQAKGLVNAKRVGGLPGVKGVEGSHADRALARIEAVEADGAYVLVSHPCRNDVEMHGFAFKVSHEENDVGKDRAGQAEVFTDPRILAAVERKGIVPARYTDVV